MFSTDSISTDWFLKINIKNKEINFYPNDPFERSLFKFVLLKWGNSVFLPDLNFNMLILLRFWIVYFYSLSFKYRNKRIWYKWYILYQV